MQRGVARIAIVAGAMGAAVATAAAQNGSPDPKLIGSPNICIDDAGSRGWCGDGSRATHARLGGPEDIAPLRGGGFLIADALNHVVRQVDAKGVIRTVAGVGFDGYSGDGGPATRAQLSDPTGVAELPQGGFVIADPVAHVVRKVRRKGTVVTLAGTGTWGSSPDGGLARESPLSGPRDVAALADGGVLIADRWDQRIRLVTPDGRITTIAGTGGQGTAGEGGPARAAQLDNPTQIAVEPSGGILIVDEGDGGRVLRVRPEGTIVTVAGGLRPGTPATELDLDNPSGVATTGDGGFLVTEAAHVRRVRPDGSTQVVVGTDGFGFNGDGRRATATELALPSAVAWLGSGRALVADQANDRVRRFTLTGGLRTVAGFDKPAPTFRPFNERRGDPPVGAGTVFSATASKCTEKAQAGNYNVLRVKPLDPATVKAKAGKSMKFTIETSLPANITARLIPKGKKKSKLTTTRRLSGKKVFKIGKAPGKGTYRLKLTGQAKVNGKLAKRCAERPLKITK